MTLVISSLTGNALETNSTLLNLNLSDNFLKMSEILYKNLNSNTASLMQKVSNKEKDDFVQI